MKGLLFSSSAFLMTFASACGSEDPPPAPANTENPSASSPAPERVDPPPLPRHRPHPRMDVDLEDRDCSANIDCTFVPTGDVCDVPTYGAINVKRAPAYAARWAQKGETCGDHGSGGRQVPRPPDALEVRCPGPFSLCKVAHIADTSCTTAIIAANETTKLWVRGAVLLRSTLPGYYRVRATGQTVPRTMRFLSGDCQSSELSSVTCASSSTCFDDIPIDAGERHVVDITGCEMGCVVEVKYLGSKPASQSEL